jgi:hypothetical protein
MNKEITTMHKYSDLKPKQKEFIHIIRDAMVQDEGIDMDDMKTSSFSRAWLRYMSSKYCDMEWAPAWIVKDPSRRDENNSGDYFIPEIFEYDKMVTTAMAEGARRQAAAAVTA